MASKQIFQLSIAAMIVSLPMGNVWLFISILSSPLFIHLSPPPPEVPIALAASIFTYCAAKTLLWYETRGLNDPRTWAE